MRRNDTGAGVRDRAYTYTAGRRAADPAVRPQPRSATRQGSRGRLLLRRAAQRVAVLVALLILFYATSLHGVSLRTFVLAGLLVLSLYWVFKGWL